MTKSTSLQNLNYSYLYVLKQSLKFPLKPKNQNKGIIQKVKLQHQESVKKYKVQTKTK